MITSFCIALSSVEVLNVPVTTGLVEVSAMIHLSFILSRNNSLPAGRFQVNSEMTEKMLNRIVAADPDNYRECGATEAECSNVAGNTKNNKKSF